MPYINNKDKLKVYMSYYDLIHQDYNNSNNIVLPSCGYCIITIENIETYW